MKFKTNISALLLATIVFLAGNGIAVFEHICNTSSTHSYSLFTKPACEMEKEVKPCCTEKPAIAKSKNCCDHKQFFSKLSVEGFTVKKMQVKPLEKQLSLNLFPAYFFHYNKRLFESYYSGLPAPDNFFQIQSLLQPTPVELQIFRC
ncbi:MAG: hypothetical protein IT271_02645 [Chitinophagales bacterium]|nr:hypothetical protein [Chitinophagales bacterium]